jgi:CRP/FNR family transcriptional regulator
MDAQDIRARVANHPLLRLLEPHILDAVLKVSKPAKLRANRHILREGEEAKAAYYLLSGAVRVYHRHTDGNEVTVKLFRAPALFGEMEILAACPFLEWVATLEPCELLVVPAEILRKLVRTQRTFAEALVKDLAARLCIATQNERALAFCDVDTRLATLLLDFAALAGTPVEGGIRIGLHITQNSMAHDLAVSRKSLVRALAKLSEHRVVDKRDGRYLILDPAALAARSTGTLGLRYSL